MEHAHVAVNGEQPTQARPKWIALGAVVVLVGLVVRDGWLTDDAYITMRTVDNWVHGYGLRWNVDERVQGFTHPLWMLLLAIVYFITRESYLTMLSLGILTTVAATLALVRAARSAGHAAAAVGLLLLSRSFVEFSTSGLENPLTHLLVAHLVWLYAVRHASLRAIALSVGLLALNRSDALLVALPAVIHVAYVSLRATGAKRTLVELAIGFSPLIAWTLFSLFYFGFPVPNTAFAKLNTGLPPGEVARQGLTYVANALAWDPPILIAMGLGVVVGFAQRKLREALLAVGVLLYLAYVVKIGGDFMLGRFLTLPLFLAVCLVAISELPLENPARLAIVVLPFLALFFHPSALERYPVGDFHHSGVADERFYYREATGLMFFTRTHGLPNHQWVTAGRAAGVRGERVAVIESIGFFGFFAGPSVHVIDLNALTDPLLARLPARYNPSWRVGHYLRELPAGYVETVKTGRCKLEDPNLCAYYEKLREIVAGDLFSLSRLKTIIGMNLGAYDYLLDHQRYRHPGILRLPLVELSTPVGEEAPWDTPGSRIVGPDGVEVDLGGVHHADQLRVSVDSNDAYELEFKRGPATLASTVSPSLGFGHLRSRTIEVPVEAVDAGYDRIWIRPVAGDGKYAVAYLRLRQTSGPH